MLSFQVSFRLVVQSSNNVKTFISEKYQLNMRETYYTKLSC